jgi:ABC-type Co2+ transport system permease subunit
MLVALLLALLGFALLALSQERHLARIFKQNQHLAPNSRAQRATSFIAISLSLPACITSQGAGFGSLLWGVLICAAAMAIAFTLTWRPQWLRPLARAAQTVFQRPPFLTTVR